MQRQLSMRSLNRSQQAPLRIAFGYSESVEGKVRHLESHNNELQETKKSGDSPTKREDFLLESNGVHVEDINGYYFAACVL